MTNYKEARSLFQVAGMRLNSQTHPPLLLFFVRVVPRQPTQKLEARCHFCGKVYQMNVDELRKQLAEAKGDPSKDDDY